MKLCVQNLPFSVTEAQLREHFEQVADVQKVSVIFDKDTGRAKGFGFVEMVDGDAAIEQLNGVELFGRQLRVEVARERERPRYDSRQGDHRNGGANGNRR